MPIPTPNDKEKRKEFMSRCITDLSEKGEFKDGKQRAAVCSSQFEKAKEESNASAGEGDTEFLVFTSAAYDYSGKKKDKEKSKSMKKYSSYGSPNPQDHYFEKKEDAEKDAEKMGLKGVHTHKDKDGKTLYMAGPSHEAFMKKHKEILKDKDKSDSSLWENIRKKRERIKRGSKERMRKKGEKGAPTEKQIKKAQNDE
jgi:hypothetical protein